MSFLAELLSVAEKVELNEINCKVPELTAVVESLKSEAQQYLDNVYIKYNKKPAQVQNELLLLEALKIQEDLSELKKNADLYVDRELTKSSNELKRSVEQLNNLNCTLSVISTLLRITEKLTFFAEQLESKSYLKCVEIIKDLEDCVYGFSDDTDLTGIFSEFKIATQTQKNILQNKLRNVFDNNVYICEKTNYVQIFIKKESEEIDKVLEAMYRSNEQVFVLHSLAKALWNNVFIPIVDEVTELEINETANTFILTVTIKNSSEKCSYSDVFFKLKTILNFLYAHFNFSLNEDMTTLKYIGQDIRDNLSELIIKHCLQETIPSNTEELQRYKTVIEETKQLEAVLIQCNIFNDDTSSLLDYANNVDIHFINKKCQEHLVSAENIMKKDLHNMMQVGSPYDNNNPLQSDIENFLQCSISKNVTELLDFTEIILQKSISASDVCAGRLFCTIQNIFTKYATFVPEYHKKLLKTIPQQVALFYNNCNYIAHILMSWDKLYCSKLEHVLGNCTFTAEILLLQNVGSEHFEACVDGQVNQIKDIMKEAAIDGATVEKLQPSTEKCVRQCLRQMELLKTVWSKVLSYKIYNKSAGVIFNTLTMSVINSVIKFEDISVESAEQLVDIIKLLLTRGPKLFTDSREVSLFVPSWYKLNELNFVLSSNLLDINDRWASGKGPLALQFTSVELRQLIRALFQNTDRRAAILAKIQD